MIVANLSDGRTLHFDLLREDEAKRWAEVQDNAQFQSSITGIGILHDGRMHVLPLPKGFRRVACSAEVVSGRDGTKVGERVVCQMEDMEASLLVYNGNTPPMARFTVNRIGWRRVGSGTIRRLIGTTRK